MDRRTLLVGFAVLPLAGTANAEQYLTETEAAHILYPEAAGFEETIEPLDRDMVKAIRKQSGIRVRKKKVRALRATADGQTIGWVYIDEVIGKHEFITYAAAIDTGGTVRGVEILDYRETWGGEVRTEDWRTQFVGHTPSDPPQLGKNIVNISGATLSCRNVTDGVSRLLATHVVLGR